ncbi:TetR/AcrR family transcriptional regulator [Holdemanella biformis]|uniref:TetR/AcrR family transcriptional regulator n=1 Tax=Holdemanella biformis TaxID=1735 RepID=UPI001C3900A0|nr:TetR/AcrR family transcriptional regulator [Holdemanella biformis]MBV4131205.1 TetR/AcrR family transcriptional regulator [Holdemanella biformis]
MSDTRKKEIILATLELAANKGLGNVSMNMIADKVGIKKPSLYNHFSSKEELVEVMYQFLSKEAKKTANIGAIDYTTFFAGKSALEILRGIVKGYFNMNQQEHMINFYKVIYSERSLNPVAAKIVAEETDRMILATKQLFYAMEVHKLLHFKKSRYECSQFCDDNTWINGL